MILRNSLFVLLGILASLLISSCSSIEMIQKSGNAKEPRPVAHSQEAVGSASNRESEDQFDNLRLAHFNDAPTFKKTLASPSVAVLRARVSAMLRSTELEDCGTVPLVMNRYVRENIRYMETRGRWLMQSLIDRSGEYIPMMKAIFEREHVPPELAYLSIPESGLDPRARSWAGAVGLWQFVRSTAFLYGLKSSWWIDDRMDPVLSTEAAARLLKNLYDNLGNWYLAIAAYNCGEITVDWAIHRSDGSRDFWKIKRYLPWETKNYVPEYIAVTSIMMDPEKYGFQDDVTTAPIISDTARVPGGVDLADISRLTGVDFDSLAILNPMLIHLITPPDSHGGYSLNVPVGTAGLFAKNYSRLLASRKPIWFYHTVWSGETLSGIAAHYGMSVHRLMAVNHLRGSFIRCGERLKVTYDFARARLYGLRNG